MTSQASKNEIISKSAKTDIIAYSEGQLDLIRNMHAKNATADELSLFLYMSEKYNLDILTKQIFMVKFFSKKKNMWLPATIFSGRDGFLAIAHRSGQFDGMESGTKVLEDQLHGWCKVFRKDMKNPFSVEVCIVEYTTGRDLWTSKPKTMITKVAESQCLRKAFSITGIYDQAEMDKKEPIDTPFEVVTDTFEWKLEHIPGLVLDKIDKIETGRDWKIIKTELFKIPICKQHWGETLKILKEHHNTWKSQGDWLAESAKRIEHNLDKND